MKREEQRRSTDTYDILRECAVNGISTELSVHAVLGRRAQLTASHEAIDRHPLCSNPLRQNSQFRQLLASHLIPTRSPSFTGEWVV